MEVAEAWQVESIPAPDSTQVNMEFFLAGVAHAVHHAAMKFLLILIVIVGALALTNPNEADFREHVRQKAGIAGTVGLAVADLVSGGEKGGIQRENYIVASKFYIGGDGVLPRQDIAWGVARQIIEIKKD